MSQCALAQLEASSRVIKRAQYEAFEFQIRDGGVRVRNNSHENPIEHEYLVSLTEGVPSTCECPADAHFDGACKHRVAVAIRTPILDAAIHQQIAADGGPNVIASTSSEVVDSERPAAVADEPESEPDSESEDECEDVGKDEVGCDCVALSSDFPCWECYRTGRRDLPQ